MHACISRRRHIGTCFGASFIVVLVLCIRAHRIHETLRARRYHVLSLAVTSACAACADQQVVSARHASCPRRPGCVGPNRGPGSCIASSCPFSPRGRTHTRIACHADVSSECESVAIAFLRQQRREEQLAEIAQSLSAPARSTGATDDSSFAPFDQVNQLCLLGQRPPQWCRGLRPRQEHSHLEQAQEGLLLAPSANVQEVCLSRYQAFVLSWLVAGTSHHLDPSLPSVCALRRRLEYRLVPCSRAERNLNDRC